MLRALLILIATTSIAAADRPHDGLFRASPGLGYAFDNAAICTMQGRMFVGGFALQYETADGLFVGGATTIIFNTLLPDGPCGVDDGLRLAIGMVAGPSVEWYPRDGALHVFALAGYAELDHASNEYQMGERIEPGRGFGGTLGIGWDWNDPASKARDARFGVRIQVTAARTFGGLVGHRALAPALVATFGLD